MSPSFIRFLLVFIGLSVAAQSHAQQSEMHRLYEQAIRDHFRDMSRLYQVRNMPNPIRAVERQISVSEGSRLVFYQFRDDGFHIWVSGEKGPIAWHVQDVPPDSLDLLLLAHRSYFERSGANRSLRQIIRTEPEDALPAIPVFDAIHETVSGLLFPEPIMKALEGASHLIVVPTRGIGSVPFYALAPPSTGEQLLDRFNIVLAPHLFIERMDFRTGRRVIVVGNPAYPEHDTFVFNPLPGAAREAEYIASLFDRPILMTGTFAGKNNVMDLYDQSLIIHMATHGIADSDSPLDHSFLALSTDYGDSNGMLTAREIQHSSIPALLVTLSACQTGLGMQHEGGVIGLARTFLKAGSHNVVMSLWSVDDEATEILMKHFYDALLEPGNLPAWLESVSADNANAFSSYMVISGALRQAMLQLRETHPDPFFWSPFSLFSAPFQPVGE